MTTDEAIEAAAARLARGRLVAFPTETVYGLGADASDAIAVARIFAAKGRPTDHPLIVHLPTGGDPLQWAREVPPLARRLIDRFWPGPLTLILPRREGVGEAAAGGQDSIGLRCPSHPVAQALLARYAAMRVDGIDRGAVPIGIAAPSANRFGRVSPTRAQHVVDEFAGASITDVDAAVFVVDGGDCPVGIESTIVDCSRLDAMGPVLLRPGSVTAAMLAEVIGALPAAADRDAPKASGTLESHYAPTTPVRLVDAAMLDDVPTDVVVWSHSRPSPAGRDGWERAPTDATDYAMRLYATLRALDRRGARAIWLEAPPSTAEWAGVNDRLGRAASKEWNADWGRRHDEPSCPSVDEAMRASRTTRSPTGCDMEQDARKLELTESARPPWDGLLLGWGAMLPFGACAVWAWTGDAQAVDAAQGIARLWGAALLLFFSGVRRGLSFRTEGGPGVEQMLVFAILFVAGLAVLLMSTKPGLGLLASAFAFLAVEDTRAARRGDAPLYFARLRPWQMTFAAVMVGSCWAA